MTYGLILTILMIATGMTRLFADEVFSDSLFVEKDSLLYPVYSYEHIPDFNYEEIEKRFLDLESEIPLTFNTRIKAFIDYFTIKDREYTKMVLGRLDLYFPMFEKYFKE